MRNFDPFDWYWLATDGRVFSSKRQATVAGDDADYKAFSATTAPTPWPRDAAAVQTSAALQEVLAPYGLFVDLASYAAARRYTKEIGGIVVSGMSIDTSRESQSMIANAYSYVQASNAESVRFKAASGWVTMSADQIKAIALAVGAHVQAAFKIESDLADGIAAFPPTITSREQIDAAFA
ncbi:DUF4376 domain-containing protein [Rhodopseudomonas sp. B29]|uniref:DUF4376 domain-containing protein n=1 Tax=Rhodopseudomonas sp. B29 TaxID=95607 RepID=UPI0003B66A4E|nr:DUF4376 domain-containing protein [Rhodopseudomonas sp. B29]